MQIMLFDIALETLTVNREYFRHIYKIEQLASNTPLAKPD